MDGGKPKKAAAVPPARRTGETPAKKKVTVSQATIDKIKAQGMTAAIKTAAAGGVSASYMEGVKRLYGASRLAKATAANINPKPTKLTAGMGRSSKGMGGATPAKPKAYGANNAPAYRPGSASSTSKPKDTRSNATKLFDLLGGKNGSNPKSKEKAAYLEAERKRVAAARKREAAARAARNK